MKPRKQSLPKPGSLNAILYEMAPGERRYVETDLGEYHDIQRLATLKSRRPKIMKGMEFSSMLFTAVATRHPGVIRYLVCVERTK
jgi:hypothetical protein